MRTAILNCSWRMSWDWECIRRGHGGWEGWRASQLDVNQCGLECLRYFILLGATVAPKTGGAIKLSRHGIGV